MSDKIDIHGVGVNVSNMGQALEEVGNLIAGGGRHYVCFFEGNLLHCALGSAEIRDVLNGATLVYPDGIAVAKMQSWKLKHSVSRVSGPSFLLAACEQGIARGWRHYFMGGKEGVAEELAATLSARYPGLQVSGTLCPPFRDMTDEEIEKLAAELSEKKVDMLWVALGGPRQDIWMHKYIGKMPVPVMLGVGAAFDFHTRHQAWAPKWVRRIGMEWLWRTCTGGPRVCRRNFVCIIHVMWQLLIDRIFG